MWDLVNIEELHEREANEARARAAQHRVRAVIDEDPRDEDDQEAAEEEDFESELDEYVDAADYGVEEISLVEEAARICALRAEIKLGLENVRKAWKSLSLSAIRGWSEHRIRRDEQSLSTAEEAFHTAADQYRGALRKRRTRMEEERVAG